ncbi:MAG: sigma-70 family RNA polymerase sigma factor [Planctomycetia bacterium]|nr:sigma-70 family RNA polymerase sigma factor [Planctomycetia bacterium]
MVKETVSKESLIWANETFLKHWSFVRYIAILKAPDPVLTDDIVNDVYLNFVQQAERWDVNRDPRPILRKLTKDIAGKYWQQHLRSTPEHLRKIAERIEQRLESREVNMDPCDLDDQLSALSVCLKKLTERSRRLLDLHYVQKIKLTRIAAEQEQNLNTLYSQIDRIRIVLRNCIENFLKTEVPDV